MSGVGLGLHSLTLGPSRRLGVRIRDFRAMLYGRGALEYRRCLGGRRPSSSSGCGSTAFVAECVRLSALYVGMGLR